MPDDTREPDPEQIIMEGEFVQDRPFHLYVRVPEGRRCSCYQVTANKVAPGVARSWTFCRIEPKPPERYTVALSLEGQVTCECLGFLYTNKCKHAGIALALVRHFGTALANVANPPPPPCRSCNGKKTFPHPDNPNWKVACPHCVTKEAK